MSNTIPSQSDAANDLTDDTFTFENEHISNIWKLKMVTAAFARAASVNKLS